MSDLRFRKPIFRSGSKSEFVRIALHKNGDCQPYNLGTFAASDFFAYFNSISRLYHDCYDYDYVTVQPVLEDELLHKTIVY